MGMTLLILLTASAGMFVAATGISTLTLWAYIFVAYLPSTFAMYGVTLAHAISLKPPSRSRTVKMFTTIGITAILSWPFSAALGSVLALQEIADSMCTRDRFLQFSHGVIRAVGIVALVLVSRFSLSFSNIQPVLHRRSGLN